MSIDSNKVSRAVILVVVFVLLTLSYAKSSLEFNAIITVTIVGIPILALSLYNNKFGILFIISLSSCVAIINRVLPVSIPFGILIDSLLYVLFAHSLIKIDQDDRKQLKNPILIGLVIWVLYYFLQVINPEGTIVGWSQGVRIMLRVPIIYIILFKVFDSLSFVEKFMRFYVAIGILAALYGIYQEFFGLPPYDLDWATATERRINLLYIGGKWRKFSFMTDPSAYGLFMALMSIVTLFLVLEAKVLKTRVLNFTLFVISIIGLFASGIRTAYVIIPVGIFVYVLFNISKPRTIAFAISSLVIFLVIYFGPFYGTTIVRFRTAFQPSDDPSMILRDMNRKFIQPYIYSHPLGGGLGTTGEAGLSLSPGHRLAGFPPDSGFMETLLELGWIGLIIELAFYSTVVYHGVIGYFYAETHRKKIIYGFFIVGFFALTIAYYAKKGVDQFPLNFFLYATFVLMTKLPYMKDDEE